MNEDREIVLTRVFDAPAEMVYRAFTSIDQIDKWWGPRGYTNETSEMDVRVGGIWKYVMHGPDGTDYDSRVVYSEVVPNERLVYDHVGEEADDPRGFNVTITFTSEGDGTRVVMRSLMKTKEARDHVVGFGAIELGNQTLEKLSEHLETLA